jgi:integrase
MITLRLYLDARYVGDGQDAPIKMSITKHGSTALLPLGVSVPVSCWDKKAQKVVGHLDRAFLNSFLMNRTLDIQHMVMDMETNGELAHLTATQIKNKIQDMLDPDFGRERLFIVRFEGYIQLCKADRTRSIYQATLNKILAFDKRARSLSFEAVTKDWLQRFDQFLIPSCPSTNARAIHLRNIRSVFNDAIDNDITNAYPFRKFHIRLEPTAKRAVSVDVLRNLFSYPVEPFQRRYVDAFRLIFCLIGINVIDLLAAGPCVDGRLQYKRAKTGRMYDIKVEPEAMEIIEHYHGHSHLVCWGEHLKSYHHFTMSLDRNLQSIGPVSHPMVNGVPVLKRTSVFPHLTSYVARHSWATIAASLDIPHEVIAHALGHGGSSVTDIYIDFDMHKVDEANRRVLDWVFYGKK